jgi:hypothetical protein
MAPKDCREASKMVQEVEGGLHPGASSCTQRSGKTEEAEGSGYMSRYILTKKFLHCFYFLYHLRVGESLLDLPRDTDIIAAPLRKLPPLVTSKKIRFGTVGMGMDLPRLVWAGETQVFSSQDMDMSPSLSNRPRKQEVKPWERLPHSFLRKQPVDVLLIDAHDHQDSRTANLLAMLEATSQTTRPKGILIAGPSTWTLDLPSDSWRRERKKRLEKLGYLSLEWFVSAEQQGSALRQERLIEVFLTPGEGRALPEPPPAQPLPARPMKNLLLPVHMIPPRSRAPAQAVHQDEVPEPPTTTLHVIGTVRGQLLHSSEGIMPDHIGAWISDVDTGIHQLQAEELAKGKGLPSEWRTKDTPLPPTSVPNATCLHIWAAACDVLGHWLKQPQTEAPSSETEQTHLPSVQPPPPPDPKDMPSAPWVYQLPDLSKGGQWYQDRLTRLREVIKGLPDEDQLWQEGLEALEIHRGNYTDAGPKYLQLLWWEFPEPHREAIRVGSSLQFLVDPEDELVPNPPLTPEQTEVVCTFVDELQALGVVRPATRPLRRVCPLFVVPKPGQPGQWRCIADMKRGGQNGCCGLDPISLPSSKDILPHLYTGGWSAIADASKHFHNFTTLPSERDLIGIIHPGTGEHLWYVGLPMGAVNSPSIACRAGEGVLDMLREESEIFRAVTYKENTWRQALTWQATYDPKLGHGYVGLRADGTPVALIFGFVDDFKIHAATAEDCCEALNAFMNLTVRLGLICQPVKTSPPKQIQKYCGFWYDTRGVPTLHIPTNKISRCIASVDFLSSRPRGQALSRLSLAIITGVLQSVVEATPHHLGQTHLRSLYDDLHHLEEGAPTTGAAKYYTRAHVSPASREALRWWRDHLLHARGSNEQSAYSGIVLKWGDGSGTGTGGTTEFYTLTPEQRSSPGIELWMGVWGARAKSNTSNWKEARTILESLLQERTTGRLRGRLVFSMTDNLVCYYIVNQGSSRNPDLHQLVREIKDACVELGCQLEVVHVPGTIMIDQGTDGLSRGLWLAPERRMDGINQRLFDPVPYTAALGDWVCSTLGLPPQALPHMSYDRPADMARIFWRTTLWTPPPECARQVIATYLRRWVQEPAHAHGIFLVPRILQRQWGRVARYVIEIGVYLPRALPPSCCYDSHLPFVLLHIPPHRPVLRRDRMELPAPAQPKGWHKHQAAAVRGLS